MTSEAASRSPRGRPPVFTDEALEQAGQFSYARRVRTRRGAYDLFYRMFAVAVIEQYREACPKDAAPLEWLLNPRRRHALLSELGRVARPTSDEQGVLRWTDPEVSRLIRAALEIAETKPPTKAGVAMIRDYRRRHRSLSHGD